VTRTTTRTRLGTAVERTDRELTELAPELVPGFRAAVPRAAGVVGRRLRGALRREGLAVGPVPSGARQHGFGRVEFTDAPDDPTDLLAGTPGADTLVTEIVDAVVHLAVAYARRGRLDDALRADAAGTDVAGPLGSVAFSAHLPPDEQVAFLEQLATEGHNLHPCGRTRFGWTTADVLAHDLETPGTSVAFVGIDECHHVGDDIGALLRIGYPGRVPDAPPGFVVQPVHAWQRRRLIANYPTIVRPLDAPPLPARPTAAVRTLLLPPDRHGTHRYLKLSLDIQVTSTRRTISVASARNGPAITSLLSRLLRHEDRVLLLGEEAGAALDAGPGRDRDAAAIVRTGLDRDMRRGEIPVPAIALPARCPLTGRPLFAELVGSDAPGFLDAYARLLLPPVLRLATRYGVGLEAHLQNSIATFRGGQPYRMVFRDLAGLRLHLPRLRARGVEPTLWPGSVVATDDVDVLRAKVAYTAFQAHLGELVAILGETHGLDEDAAWHRIRAVVDEVYAPLVADPAVGAAARADHAFLTAPTIPHKALVRMRLAPDGGDRYIPVPNPLHG
jgi:siderophore synthetase component